MDHQPVAAPALTRLQRLLVGTDGTVTHLLSVFAGEPIDVVKLAQAFDRATPADADLDIGPGEEVLRRQVLLRGRETGTDYLHAQAVVVPARVDAAVLEGLLASDEPIGRLLAAHRVETFREILRIGQAAAGASGPLLGVPATADVVYRTYRIVARKVPALLITERFPAGTLRTLPP